MKKDSIGRRTGRYLKHILITAFILAFVFIGKAYLDGHRYRYSRNDAVRIMDNEGPHIFYRDSSLYVNYVKGNKKDGFWVSTASFPAEQTVTVACYNPLDHTEFAFNVYPDPTTPPTTYNDNEDIFVVSDIESNYKTFRDLLIQHQVIDQNLNWTFGKGHLVLNGDFVDRSYFTTQVLSFIMKMEQMAALEGGHVHFILGNHEIMNMQGDHRYAKSKYAKAATVLGVKQHELYDSTTYVGKWLQSKNTMEMINGHLFVHGGINPEIAKLNMNIDEMNQFIRKHYYKKYYARKGGPKREDLLLSSYSSPYWFRGYFKDEMAMEDIQKGLDLFGAKDVIVGHTIQDEVQRLYNGKVIGVDVEHPKDYYSYFPALSAQGLLIQGDKYYRVDGNGVKEEI